jgi:hypothetical protein
MKIVADITLEEIIARIREVGRATGRSGTNFGRSTALAMLSLPANALRPQRKAG